MEPSKCIRILADEGQIFQCKADISAVEEPIQQLAGLLSLAGNELRLKIIWLLYREEQMCPCDLSDILEISVPAVSQHLRKMKDRDLVKYRKVGQTIFYSINQSHAKLLQPLFNMIK